MSQFWKGYRMLYVYSEDLTAEDILTILQKNGCSSVVSSVNQGLPLLSAITPVQNQKADSYLYRRNAFFSDKNNRTSVFYVPDNQSASLEKSIRELSAFQSTKAGTDGKASFPWFAPLISLMMFLLLLFFSRERLLFSIGSAFFILFAFSRPMYTVSAAVCLYLFACFIFHRIWGRQNFLKIALNNPYVLVFALSPVLILLLSSPVNSIFYIFALAASASSLFLYFLFESKKEKLYSFQPLYIRSAKMIPLVGRLGIRLLGGLLLCLLVILFSFKLSGSVSSISTSASMPALPSPVSHASEELPQLSDFMNWSWNYITFPYKKISPEMNKAPEEGELVSITDYQEIDGKISTVETKAFVYNSEFRDNVFKAVDKLNYPALEKMLLKQGKNARFGYSKKASTSSSERFGMILLLIFITIPAALGIYYIVGRKRYGLGI
ncbi:MAG: hypothetical protein K5873_01765 [Treponema sp.]|nr:hypothetical protein [Treponema sp.]